MICNQFPFQNEAPHLMSVKAVVSADKETVGVRVHVAPALAERYPPRTILIEHPNQFSAEVVCELRTSNDVYKRKAAPLVYAATKRFAREFSYRDIDMLFAVGMADEARDLFNRTTPNMRVDADSVETILNGVRDPLFFDALVEYLWMSRRGKYVRLDLLAYLRNHRIYDAIDELMARTD